MPIHAQPPKRLLYIAAALPPTRAPEADWALHQALHFAERGIEVHLLTRSGQQHEPQSSFTIHDVIDSWSWREVPKIIRLIKRLKPDAVMMSFLGTMYQHRTMPMMIPLLSKVLDRRVPVLVQFSAFGEGAGLGHGIRRALFDSIKGYRYGSLLPSSDALVTLSTEHYQRIVSLMPSAKKRLHIIPPSPTMVMASDPVAARQEGRRRLGLSDEDLLVTFFGRLYPGKGIEQIIEAAASIRDKHPNVRVGLIGGFLDTKVFANATASYEDELLECVRRNGMEQHVTFSGEYAWDSAEASEYLYATDVAVLPLGPGVHLYNSSLAAVCAHGAPVIGTRGAIVDSALLHKENVYFIENAQSANIAAALEEVIGDGALRETLRKGSNELAAEYFNWGRSVSRLSSLLNLQAAPTAGDAIGSLQPHLAPAGLNEVAADAGKR